MARMVNQQMLAKVQPLETADLRLVPLGPEYLDDVMLLLDDEEVSRFTGGAPGEFPRETVLEHLTTMTSRDDRADWAVIRKQDERFLGEAVLNELHTHNGVMNFRIALFGSDVLGKGFGTQVVKAVVSYGFEAVGLHRIELGVFDTNPRAQRAYEKAGFVREGVRRESELIDGKRHDEIIMSILAHEYRALQTASPG